MYLVSAIALRAGLSGPSYCSGDDQGLKPGGPGVPSPIPAQGAFGSLSGSKAAGRNPCIPQWVRLMSPWLCLAWCQVCPELVRWRPTSLDAAKRPWLLLRVCPQDPRKVALNSPHPNSALRQSRKSLGTGQHCSIPSWQWLWLPAHPFPDFLQLLLPS